MTEHPEIVVFGLPSNVGHWIINELRTRIKEGERFAGGDRVEGLLEGDYVCLINEVQRCWYEALFGYAEWFYRGNHFPVIQVVWPDKANLYPWQSGFNPAWLNKQPLLDRMDPVEARMEGLLAPSASGCTCNASVKDWHFEDDPHRSTFTQRHVTAGEKPILFVCRETDDGDWQFLDGSQAPENLVVVCMHHLIELDSSLNELVDLPLGWQAWRATPEDAWNRGPMSD